MTLRLAALALLAGASCSDRAQPASKPPELYLITGLPLLFGEDFSLDSQRPVVTGLLEQHYRLTAIDLPGQVPAKATLLMVQPRALPAEELVALDRWVRRGGRLLLLADPRLEWPSERPLGDKLRPPPMYADTGLLGHWGLRLDSPERSGPVTVGGVTYASPGTLVASGPACAVENRIVARCKLGRGRAIVVADADWIRESPAGIKPLLDSLKR